MMSKVLTRLLADPIVDSSGIVEGFVNYYDASGYLNGNAEVQSTSINYPYNTETDSLNIR
jgi:hypothetical protein